MGRPGMVAPMTSSSARTVIDSNPDPTPGTNSLMNSSARDCDAGGEDVAALERAPSWSIAARLILHAVRVTAAAIIALSVAICAQGPDSAMGAIGYTDVEPLWSTLRPILPAAVRQATPGPIAETRTLWVS